MCLNRCDIAAVFLIVASIQISVDFAKATTSHEVSAESTASLVGVPTATKSTLKEKDVFSSFQTNSIRQRSTRQGTISTEIVTATYNQPTLKPSSLMSTSAISTSTNSSRRGMGDDNRDNRQKFYNGNRTIIKKQERKNQNLIGFFLACFTQTDFEVRYANGTLCACGKANIMLVHCKTKLPLNFAVHLSEEKMAFSNTRRNRKCSFLFVYENRLWPRREAITLNQRNYSRTSCNSTEFLMNVSSITKTDFAILTTSVIGQSRGTSSMTNTQFVPQNSTTYSGETREDAGFESQISFDTKNSTLFWTNHQSSVQSTLASSVVLSSLLATEANPTQTVNSSIFAKESPTFSESFHRPTRFPNGGKSHESYVNKTITKTNGMLIGVFVRCFTQTDFAVYANEVLCASDRSKLKFLYCKEKLPLHPNTNFIFYISHNNVTRTAKRQCLFYLVFEGPSIYSAIGLPEKVGTTGLNKSSVFATASLRTHISSAQVPHIATTTFATNTASSDGQLSAASFSQVGSENSMRKSRPISSIMAKSESSKSFNPSNTGIVFTSVFSPPSLKSLTLSIKPSPTISVSQDSNPGTLGLGISQYSTIQDTSSSSYIHATPSTSTVVSVTTLSPVEEEKKKLNEDIDFLDGLDISKVDIGDEETIGRVLDAAANLINTNLTLDDQKKDPGLKAVEALQDLGNTISRQLDLGNETSDTFQKVTKDLVFGVAVINATTTPGFSFPSGENNNISDEKIDIPTSVFASESGKSYFVGIIFKAYRAMRNDTGGFMIGTKVINAVVSPSPNEVLTEPVKMTFEKNTIETIEPKCSFWLENNSLSGDYGRWSTRQCYSKKENNSHIICECSHFTNFAVLFKVSDEKISDEDTFRLVIITYIGLGLSILGCLFTFIIYVSLSNIKSDRSTIHTNLVAALGIADVIFLITVAVQPSGDPCLALSMLAFFFYLAVFFWMLVEGVYIYLMVDVMEVFRGNAAFRRRMAYLVGWGGPIIIAAVTWVVLRDRVVSKYHCWLSVESGAIWAFVGPGLLIILINSFILWTAIKTTWKTFVDDKEFRALKSATKTFAAVIPVLGITWIFGVMAFNESSVVFQYVFAITNSIQGALIFILYCIVNREVRNELRRKLAIWQTRREMSSSSGGGRRRTPDFYQYPLGEVKVKPGEEQMEQRYTFEDPINASEKETEMGEKNDAWNGELCTFGKDEAAINNEAYEKDSIAGAGDVQGL